MAERKTLFADVILPLALPNLFTYRIPFELNDIIHPGQRVIVSFGGGQKLYTALIKKLHTTPPSNYEAKYIEGLLDENEVVNAQQFQLWEWMQDYYMCMPGEVMNAALPGAMKLSSETRIVLHEEFREHSDNLTDKEFLIVDALEVRNMLDLAEISSILGVKHVHPYVKALIEKRVIIVLEEVKQKYKPREIAYVQLTEEASTEEGFKRCFDLLERAPKQQETLMAFMQLQAEQEGRPAIKKLELQKRVGITAVVINQLVKKEVFEIITEEEGRIKDFEGIPVAPSALSEDQQIAKEAIQESFLTQEVSLLHGVTSSGKTEVYIQLIEEVIAAGKQVLYLLPEIALTTQIIHRLQKHFGNQIGVYHSRFNAQERVEVWKTVLEFDPEKQRKFQLILGARSSIFLPFKNLGLIIVDEEHENSFKQYDPAPRYHARDTATVLARIHGANVLLGSATPSLETYWNAKNGKYGYVALNKRYGGVRMPEILCADIAEDSKRKKMKSHFSPLLVELMEEALENKEQIILFQNRRGYAPVLMCESCGNAPQCKNCDVSLTYHKHFGNLNCHYCNYSISIPKHCPACGSPKINLKGFGTEKIEEDLALIFPEASVIRMDLDTTRSKNAYQHIISDFESGEVDILVGTQMITKGLDFDNVAVVGILNADNMLSFPDFRAFERSYQLMSQVAGRAGRKKKRGKVLIQTYNPNHAIIRNVIDHDYLGMYKDEILERKNFHYPPFYRLISFTLMHRDVHKLNDAVHLFHQQLKRQFGNRLLGPQTPVISRVRNYYHKNFMLKIERDRSLKSVKTRINELMKDFEVDDRFKGVRVKVDVDPA